MDGPDPSEQPNLNTGIPWSSWDDQDIRWGLDHNRSIEETADFLCRTPSEVRQRIQEIAEADAIGDPSLLRDGLTHRDRIALDTYRDARAAIALIREAVEDCAPPGSVAREEFSTPECSASLKHLDAPDARTEALINIFACAQSYVKVGTFYPILTL
jgi:predicted transcriptional regulator